MSVVNELIRSEQDGTLSFGNYLLETKSKLSDFEHGGDMYRVKTYNEITKLEKNGSFVYESADGVKFEVEGKEDAQITLELEEGASYAISIDGGDAGTMTTNMGGKLVLSVEFTDNKGVSVEVKRA